ncbi:hypothetical protein GL2_19070 [Microbulbifer sp. GL-2]|nr:hypothetical protein GL2_19070 [Microbulbifer sp. GL-2]
MVRLGLCAGTSVGSAQALRAREVKTMAIAARNVRYMKYLLFVEIGNARCEKYTGRLALRRVFGREKMFVVIDLVGKAQGYLLRLRR